MAVCNRVRSVRPCRRGASGGRGSTRNRLRGGGSSSISLVRAPRRCVGRNTTRRRRAREPPLWPRRQQSAAVVSSAPGAAVSRWRWRSPPALRPAYGAVRTGWRRRARDWRAGEGLLPDRHRPRRGAAGDQRGPDGGRAGDRDLRAVRVPRVDRPSNTSAPPAARAGRLLLLPPCAGHVHRGRDFENVRRKPRRLEYTRRAGLHPPLAIAGGEV